MKAKIAVAVALISSVLVILDLIPGNQGESVLRQVLEYLRQLV